jgi:drug/metabolite transporter (DMT)-like permease
VVWAEQYVPSSIAALMSATIPLWMVLINWLRLGAARPGQIIKVGRTYKCMCNILPSFPLIG